MSIQSPSSSPEKARRARRRLRTPFGDRMKLVRVAAVAVLFVAASLANIRAQSARMLEELRRPRTATATGRGGPPAGRNAGGAGAEGVATTPCAAFGAPAPAALWRRLADRTLAASHFPEYYASNANFTSWVDGLFRSEYPVRRLRRSTMHPPDPAAALRLLEVANDRFRFLRGGGRAAAASSPSSQPPPPPLHILVMGGSVTAGMGCGVNQFGMNPLRWTSEHLACAWPARLERLFNHVLFEGLDVARVTNLAVGGASTEVGKVVLEYHLFPEEAKENPPHVVVWAHAANDSQEADKRAVERDHLPGFVRAARDLRRCDEELPLVVLLDDFYGAENYADVNGVSKMLYAAASWYGLMAVSHSNVLRREVYANYGNLSRIAEVLGGNGKLSLHPGIGGHVGVAWTVFFNFLKAFVESCDDGAAPDGGGANESSGNSLHVKYLDGYTEDETIASLQARWRQNSHRTKEQCLDGGSAPDGEACTYAWMVNPAAGVTKAQTVWMRLKDVVVFNDGWNAMGELGRC